MDGPASMSGEKYWVHRAVIINPHDEILRMIYPLIDQPFHEDCMTKSPPQTPVAL